MGTDPAGDNQSNSVNATTPTDPPALSRKPRAANVKLLLGVLLLGIGGAFLFCLILTFLPPGWYDPPTSNDPDAAYLAEQAEFRLVEELQKIRPKGEPWRLRIPDKAVNAWLALRLEDWLAHDDHPQWPDFITVPQVHATPSGIFVAVGLVKHGRVTSILGMKVLPTIAEGNIVLSINGGLLGRLPVPTPPSTLLEPLRTAAAEGDDASGFVVDYLLDGNGFPAILELVDDRIVEIDGVSLGDGDITITARTLPPPGS
ncbi:MAG: hypothetical protein VX908_04570 [Planctomycetota bacterium]|nr:hypothetical protein [Planctomycetota bacterium]